MCFSRLLTFIMGLITKKKILPKPTGHYGTSCADLMTGFSKDSIFVRLYYPSGLAVENEQKLHWFPWVPHDKYVEGLARVVGLWEFIIRVVMWWYGGIMHIPIMFEAKPKPLKQNKKMPVIIFSHGFGAARFFCSNMLNELASQGYVIASLEHRDTSACATYYFESPAHRDKNKRTWIPHTRLKLGAEHFHLRQRQVQERRDECIMTLNMLTKINNGDISINVLHTALNLSCFKDQLDLDQVTIMGHSFGGATALMTLAADDRFRQGVILDGWMYPLKGDCSVISQPLLFINSPTFHISSNLAVMDRYIKNPQGAFRQLYTIRHSTHETPTDSPFVLGYWLDKLKTKLDPKLGSLITNYLIINFLQRYTGLSEDITRIQEVLEDHCHLIFEGTLPDAVPARKAFF